MADIDLKKLDEDIRASRTETEPYRLNLVEHVSQFVGSHWNDAAAGMPMGEIVKSSRTNPINLLSLAVNSYHRLLVGNDPRMLTSTFDRKLRPIVNAMQGWGNKELVRMKFGETLRKAVMNGLFLMGITKVSLTKPDEASFGGYMKANAEVSASNVAFEDFYFDAKAKSWHECDYIGNDYLALYDQVRKSSLYKRKPRKSMQPTENFRTDETGNDRLSSLGRGASDGRNDYYQKVRLREVYLPRENLIITYDPYGDLDEPLAVQKWVGPRCGPYHILSFMDVVDNLMPKSPVMDWIDLHLELNRHWRKLGNQASAQKNNVAFRDQQDQKAHEKARDGSYIRMNDPEGLKAISTGGPNNLVQMHLMNGLQLFNKMAGNLDAIAGLGAQSDTATQDKLLFGSSSKQVEAMSQRTVAFAEQLMRSISWFFWHDPNKTMRTKYQVPGLPDIETDREVTPLDRTQLPFEEIDINMDPYSTTYQTPQQKVATMQTMMKEVFIPLFPMFQQPGASDLLQEYVKKVAKFTNTPELEELLDKVIGVQGMIQQQTTDGQSQEPGMPAETTRNYERISKPGMTDRGQTDVMKQLLAGGDPQGEGMEQLMNPGAM